MPLLIKSSNGKRTCSLLTKENSAKDAFTPEDIITALRGLTLKVEMKIVDVLLPASSQEATAAPSTNGITSGSTSSVTKQPEPEPKSETNPAPTQSAPASSPPTSVARAAPAQPTIIRDNLIPPQVLRAKLLENQAEAPKPSTGNPVETSKPSLSQPKLVSEPTKNQREPLTKRLEAPTSVSGTDKLELQSTKADPKPVDSDKTKLIKGSLKVGSLITTYCLAVEQTDPPIVYVPYDTDKIHRIGEMISELAHDIENLPPVESLRGGDIVLGKSNDDNSWYRAMVESVEASQADVFFFDWGLREKLPSERVKRLTYQELGLSESPACALKLTFKNSRQELIDESLSCEVIFEARVDSYDFETECYEVAIIKTDAPA